MKINRFKGAKIFTLTVSLLVIVGSIIFTGNIIDGKLQAAATTTDVKIAQAQFHNESATLGGYVVTVTGEVFESNNPYNGVPFRRLKVADGTPLKNIKKVVTQDDTNLNSQNVHRIALTNDGKIYGWGEGTSGQFGDGLNLSYSVPTLINTSVDGQIKDIAVGHFNTYLLLGNGDLYATGRGNSGELGNGSNTSSATFVKVNVSNIKQVMANANNCYALDTSGYIWTWGSLRFGTGVSMSSTPTKLKNEDGSTFDIKAKLLAESVTANEFEYSQVNSGIVSGGNGLTFLGVDNKIYYLKDRYASFLGSNSFYPKEVVFSYPDLSNVTYMTAGFYNLSAVVDGTLYGISDPILFSDGMYDTSSNQREQNNIFAQFIHGGISAGSKVLSGSQTYATSWAIRDDNQLFIKGKAAEYVVDLTIKGYTQGSDKYVENQKYNSNIYLDVVKSSEFGGKAIKYKYTDLLTNTTSAEATYDEYSDFIVTATDNVRVNRRYKFYIEGREEDTAAFFTVDLYNHSFTDVKVDEDELLNNTRYPTESQITWDSTNGLAGNVVTAKLTMPESEGSTVKTIESGYDFGTIAGIYQLNLTDLYGNLLATNFYIDTVASPTGVLLNDAGSFVYNNDYTKEGARLGELTLKFAPSATPSNIVELSISSGNSENNFKVQKDSETNKWYLVANKTIPVGNYSLEFTGKAGIRSFTRRQLKNSGDENPRTISIEKADNPMTWNAATQTAINNGIFVDESLSVGIIDKPDEIGAVSYSLATPPPTGVSIDSSTGKVKITAISEDQVTIPIIASTITTANYKEKELTANITARKQTLDLKTVSVEGAVEKDNMQYELGATLPSFKVVPKTTLPSGITLPQPDRYKIIRQGDASETEVTTITTEGTYLIKPVYQAETLDQYNVIWTYGNIVAREVTIDDSNASSYYTLTLNDGLNTSYEPGTWTNKDIIITPKHSTYTKMKIDTGSYATGAQTYRAEGTNTIRLSFQTASGIEATTTITNIKIDRTKPTMTDITYTDTNTSMLASILRAVTFNKFFSSEQVATFSGTDTAGSGIESYRYELSQIDEEGILITGTTKEQGEGSSVTLPKNKNYKLDVKAIDKAKNESEIFTHYIQISDVAPVINVTATIAGTTTAYDGTKWTSKAIDVDVSSEQNITKYSYSTDDGTTYLPITNGTMNIPNTENINDKTYTFKGVSSTDVPGFNTMKIKIDKDVPVFQLKTSLDNGDEYDGSETERNVIVTLSQTTPNISGVDYYYCDNSALSSSNPIDNPSGWTKVSEVNGTKVTFDDTQLNKTFYFKAVSKAGLVSADAKAQEVIIQKKTDNPDDLVWETPGDQDVTYGTSIPLTIMLGETEVIASDISITPTGGTNCLSYDDTTREVTAISGSCPIDGEMSIAAQVGTYREPLRKKIYAKKADLQLQTGFVVSGVSSKTATILKDGTIPPLTVDYVNGKGLIASDANLASDASTLGSYITKYTKQDGSNLSVIDTSILGNYKIKQNLAVNSVSAITSFPSKYNVTSLDATLSINDNNFTDSELYEIQEVPNEDGWFTERVTITPVHTEFTKMGINGSTGIIGSQTYPNGDVIDTQDEVNLKFYDASANFVTKNPIIKIDSRVPEVQVEAKSNGITYNGSQTEHDVTIKLSQPTTNISGVTYYYCTNLSTSQSSPTGNGWTKVTSTGNSLKLDTTQNKTYYFKAISGAGLISEHATSQTVNILKRESNPVDMVWSSEVKDDLAYGESTTLLIENTRGNSITYTSEGGEGCLSLDTTTGLVTALSGTCATDMEVTAQVGNYANPLEKTIRTHKANLDFQTVFYDGVTANKTATILRNEQVPDTIVQLINATSLKGAEASLDITTIGTYRAYYTINGTTTTGINTAELGEYKVSKKLDTSTVTIANFANKYNINLQEVANLSIVDNDIPANQLYTITGDHVNDEWYTDAVKITPIHPTFTKMGINGGTTSTQAQIYPKDGTVDIDTTILLTFENNGGSSISKSGVPIKIDSIIPDFRIVAKSNRADYTSGTSTLYDIDITFVSTSNNLSGEDFYYTTDVASNGNLKPNANWIESGDFQIVNNATYYMKAISGAGLESTPKKFIANINKPDTTKTPTINTTSNGKSFVADGSSWARNEVTFKLAGNATGYEVCVSTDKDRRVECDDTSYNWTTIDDEANSIHRVTQDQAATNYWFRNKIAGFQTTATPAYTLMLDSVVPDTPQIIVSEKQNAFMSLFSRTSTDFYNKAVNVEIQANDASSGIASIVYDVYDADDKLIKADQAYSDVLTYEDSNLQLRAKAIDKAGNISVMSDKVAVRVDTIAPEISGITKDASYYVPYVFISYEDKGSGIDSANTTYTNNDTTDVLGNHTLFNGIGNVSIQVQDNAGNATSLSFEMLGLPEHLDCSEESFALIDTVKAQYEDVKGHLNDTQKKEITDWMAKTSNSCSVTDPEHNVTVENKDALIPENTVLVVDVITTTIDDVKLELGKGEEVKMAYDVYFKKGETIFKDLSGSLMKVKLPLGAFKGANGLRLVSVGEDGTTKDITYETEGDYAVFTTNELTRYAFIAEKNNDPNVNVDVDCDGEPDINIDTGGDGIPDINIDTTGDGIPDYNITLDDDDIPDLNIGPVDWNPDKCGTTSCGIPFCTSSYYKPYLNIDTDGDKRPDINIDLNKDMEADINIDTSFDDIPDVDIDSTGDGKADINIDDDGDGEADRNLLKLKVWTPNKNVNEPIKYDTMENLIADDTSDSNNGGSNTSTDENNKVVVHPSVKGEYAGGVGGAMTGQANTLPMLFVMLLGSATILYSLKKKKA